MPSHSSRRRSAPSQLAHGLRARAELPAADAAEVRALSSAASLCQELEGVFKAATWVAIQLKDAPTLSKADHTALVFAEIASRANESILGIQAGRFTDKHGRAGLNAAQVGSSDALRKAIERERVVTAFVVQRTRRAFAWFQEHGVMEPDGKPMYSLQYFGSYLAKVLRCATTLAAMISVSGREGDTLESFLGGDDGGENA